MSNDYGHGSLMVVDNKQFEGKSDPTQYSIEDDIIYVKSNYNIHKDVEGWIIHEYEHSKQKNVKDDKKEYPYNNIERMAYIAQFKWLKKTGKALTFNDIQDKKKFPTLSLKFIKYNGAWKEILKKYWELANGKVEE